MLTPTADKVRVDLLQSYTMSLNRGPYVTEITARKVPCAH